MDQQFKQRMIGALVLVALAVIIVPFLVQPPQPERRSETLPVTIPKPSQPKVETRELRLDAMRPSPARQTTNASSAITAPRNQADTQSRIANKPAASSGLPSQPTQVDERARERTTVSMPLTPKPQNNTVREPRSASTTQANKPTNQPTSAPKPETSDAPSNTTATPEAETSPPSQPVSKPSTDVVPKSGYVVNVVALTNLARADQLLAKLKADGLPAYGESISIQGKPAKRVRLGPYATKARAEVARPKATLIAGGAKTSVVYLGDAPVGVNPPSVPADAGAVKAGYVVQVAAVGKQADADRMVDKLRKQGYTAFTEAINTDNGKVWRVSIGPEINKKRAKDIATKVGKSYGTKPMVQSYP